MQYIFNLKDETPSKKNSRVTNTKTGRTFPNKRFTQWHAQALKELKPQIINAGITEPLNEPIILTLIFTHGDKRRRDSDNGASSICDLMTDSGLIIDDNYSIIPAIRILNRYDKNNAHCKIIINTGYNVNEEINNIYKMTF